MRPDPNLGFSEDELCQNLHRRHPEEARRLVMQARERVAALQATTFEDWSRALAGSRQETTTSCIGSASDGLPRQPDPSRQSIGLGDLPPLDPSRQSIGLGDLPDPPGQDPSPQLDPPGQDSSPQWLRPDPNLGFSEEELCQHLYRQDLEEARRWRRQAMERIAALKELTFEDWSRRLASFHQAATTSCMASASSNEGWQLV